MQKLSRQTLAALLIFVGILGFLTIAWAQTGHKRGFAPNDACVGNARLLEMAVVQYTEENDEFLPPMHTQQEFQAAVQPYVQSPNPATVFVCPDTGLPYIPNAAVSGHSLYPFNDLTTIELFRDAQPHEDGQSTIAYFPSFANETIVDRGGVEQGDPNQLCIRNVQAISFAVIQYTQDYDEKLPPTHTEAEFETALYPFLSNPRFFTCPVTHQPYTPNPAISGLPFFTIQKPYATVLVSDSEPHPDGKSTVGYVDGHIEQNGIRVPPASSRGNAAQILLAVIQYSQDYDGYLPPMQNYGDFEAALLPYAGNNPNLFFSPNNGKPFTLNTALSGQNFNNYLNPNLVEFLRDDSRNPDGSFTVAYLDGHVVNTPYFVPIALAVGPDNQTRLLWRNSIHEAAVWTLSPTGDVQTKKTYNLYGSDYFRSPTTLRSFAVGGDNKTRLVWDRGNGAITLQTLSLAGPVETESVFGPYDGWTPGALAIGPDNAGRLDWQRYDGQDALWTVSPTDRYVGDIRLKPAPGASEVGLVIGSDGLTRELWKNTNGTATLWTLNAQGKRASSATFGLQGLTIAALGIGPDNRPVLLWDQGSGQASVWTLTAQGALVSVQTITLENGWTPKEIAVGPDGNWRVLWTNADAHGRLQTLLPDGTVVSDHEFAPYQ